MDSEEENPRVTKVGNNTQEEERIQQTICDIQEAENKDVFFVLSKFIKVPEIKIEPDLIESLFRDNLTIVAEMIDWMLIPKFLIKHRRIKSNVDGYPYHCKEFMKDNWCFYEQLYIHARNGKLSLDIWFKFLEKEYYDPVTIYTALGYFAEVMIPFAKYEFSGSYSLTQSLGDCLEKSFTLGIMKIINEAILEEIIKFSHHHQIYQFLTTAILVSIEDPNDAVFSEKAFIKLFCSAKKTLQFSSDLTETQRQNIIENSELLDHIADTLRETISNIEPEAALCPRSESLVRILLESGIIEHAIEMITNSSYCSSELRITFSRSISEPKHHGDSEIVEMLMNSSMQCSPEKRSTSTQEPEASEEEECLIENLMKILTYSVEIFIKVPKTLGSSFTALIKHGNNRSVLCDSEESLMQTIFEAKSEKSGENDELVDSIGILSPLIRERRSIQIDNYQTLISSFREQMQDLLNSLPKINLIVYKPLPSDTLASFSSKTIKFSSGQNIKPITFLKYHYFKLIHSVLIMVHCREIENDCSERDSGQKQPRNSDNSFVMEIEEKEDVLDDERGEKWSEQEAIKVKKTMRPEDTEKVNIDYQIKVKKTNSNTLHSMRSRLNRKSLTRIEPFHFQLQKLYLIEVIEKYLKENRWNNITHKILEKIFHLLVMREYEYLRSKIRKDSSKKSDGNFISYLIESFTQKDYIFLDTFKFTSQGNLHSLYNIAKDLAYTLNSSNQLVLLLNEFMPWKKFLMNDLKKYEEKTYPQRILPEFWDESKDGEEMRQSFGAKVDEVDSIKKLIENIEFSNKWPRRMVKHRGASKSLIFRKSQAPKEKQNDHMYKSHDGPRHTHSSNEKPKKSLDDLLKKKNRVQQRWGHQQ